MSRMKTTPRTPDVYEMLRAKIDLTEVVSRFANIENGVCFCPLKEQSSKNPGFKIYDDSFYCFSCGAWGDAVSFWRLKHDFPSNWEAAQDLAHEYGIELPQPDPEARKRYEERRRKEESWAEVAKESHARLLEDNPRAKRARAYLTDRGFTEEHRERFLLGLNKSRDRVTIPYFSGGQIHGTVDRALKPDAVPKYLYPKAEEFALGRRPLFMQESPRAREYLLVEGFFDQLAAAALGIPAIASGSAGFSNEQLADLLDMAAKGATFVICRDRDERGIEGAQTMLEKLYPYARLMPDLPGDGKDIADFYKEHGEAADEIRGHMAKAQDAVELAVSELADIKRPADKVKLLKHVIVPCLLRIQDRSERGAVAKWVAKADGLNTEIVRDAIAEVEGKLIVEDEAPAEDLPEEEWAHLLEPGVLNRYVEDACKIKGVVGKTDKMVVKLLAADAVEAQLEPLPNGKPVGGAVMLTGDTGRGKNFLADAAVSALPPSWYIAFEAASATAFYYAADINPAFLKHKCIYPNEAEAVDTVVEFLRPMLSQAKAKKYVTNKNGDGSHVFQQIDVEGPITGVIPTTRNTLNRELQSRLLICELEDYEGRIKDHTRALSRQFSPDFVANPHGSVIPKWRAALSSLTDVRRVVIPFGSREEFMLTDEEIKHGARLWGNLLGLVCAHAWLEQRNREVCEISEGVRAVVATAADYEAAYDLLNSVGGRSIVNLGDTHRKIVLAVLALKDEGENCMFSPDGFSVREIAKKAQISPGTVSKNRAFLTMSAGLLYETDEKKLQVVDDIDPAELESAETKDAMKGFPSPATVRAWEGNTPPSAPGNIGNTETPEQEADTYAEKVFPDAGNTQETQETPNGNGYHPNGDNHRAERPLSDDLKSGESATLEDLKARRAKERKEAPGADPFSDELTAEEQRVLDLLPADGEEMAIADWDKAARMGGREFITVLEGLQAKGRVKDGKFGYFGRATPAGATTTNSSPNVSTSEQE
jgi:hypothetical protein